MIHSLQAPHLALLELLALKYSRVGSTVTCDPAPIGTDFDYLVLINPKSVESFMLSLKVLGFEIEMGEGYASAAITDTLNPDAFNSFRCDDVNFIVTASFEFYEKFMLASNLAKRLNLLKKDDRVALFQAMLYGVEMPLPCDLPPFPPTWTLPL